jgi:uncharacterized membrane protein YphA (DoxX/SURF4 family)
MLLLRLVIGAVFIYASVDKCLHPDRFADIVSDYQLLPPAFVNVFSIVLPWVELLTGVLLFLGAWVEATTVLAGGMTVMFIVAVAASLVRGTEHFHCGCFSTALGDPTDGTGLLLRDIALLLACVALWLLCRRSESRA